MIEYKIKMVVFCIPTYMQVCGITIHGYVEGVVFLSKVSLTMIEYNYGNRSEANIERTKLCNYARNDHFNT